MRILMPFTRAVGGGSFVSAAVLAEGLRANGVDVLALFPEEGPSTEVFRKHKIPLRLLRDFPVVAAYKRSALEVVRYVGDFIGTYRAASRFLAQERFDFVHLNDGTTVLPWGLAAKRHGIATIWHIRGGSIGYTDRLRLQVSDHRICISHFVADRLPPGTRSHVLYNPAIAPEPLAPEARKVLRMELGVQDGDLHLLQIGRDVPYKRPEWAVATLRALFEQNISASLTFLGEFTPHRQKTLLQALPTALHPRVRFPGWVMDPDRYLVSADILLHPARGEHFGRIFAEAALSQVHFIATPTGAAPELIKEGLPGMVSAADTQESYCAKVVEFTQRRPNLRTEGFAPPCWLDPQQNARAFIEKVVAR